MAAETVDLLFLSAESPWARPGGAFTFAGHTAEDFARIRPMALLCIESDAAGNVRVPATVPLVAASALMPPRKVKRWAQMQAILRRQPLTIGPMLHVSASRIAAEIARFSPRVVIVNHIRSAWLIPRLNALYPARYVYLSQNAEFAVQFDLMNAEANPLLRRILRVDAYALQRTETAIVSAATVTTALSDVDAARFRSLVPQADVRIIPPSVSPAKAMPTGTGTLNRMLLVGSFLFRPKRANGRWLIREVFSRVRAELPDFRLDVAGHGANLLGVAAEAPGVRVYNSPPEVDPFYETAAVFAIPEGQVGGIKVKTLEAAARAAPIVSLPGGVEGTGLRNGESCLVATTAEEFASAVVRLARDPDLRRKLGEAARDHILARYGREVVYQNVQAVAALADP